MTIGKATASRSVTLRLTEWADLAEIMEAMRYDSVNRGIAYSILQAKRAIARIDGPAATLDQAPRKKGKKA